MTLLGDRPRVFIGRRMRIGTAGAGPLLLLNGRVRRIRARPPPGAHGRRPSRCSETRRSIRTAQKMNEDQRSWPRGCSGRQTLFPSRFLTQLDADTFGMSVLDRYAVAVGAYLGIQQCRPFFAQREHDKLPVQQNALAQTANRCRHTIAAHLIQARPWSIRDR
jgi:hypothetical protein